MVTVTDFSRFRRSLASDASLSTWPAADGWTLRRFDWPAPAGSTRGAILFQGGRGDVIEKYLELFAHFHHVGWAVTSFDWRGQGGSGRLSPAQNVGHAASFAPWIDDLAAFWHDWSDAHRDGPRVLIGHSMGGYLALRAALDGLVDPAALVLVAPMLGLRSPIGPRWGERLARFMMGRGDPARPAWKASEHPDQRLSRQALLTADLARFADEDWWYAQNPAIRLGPPSWAWLVEAFATTRVLAADPRLETFDTPTQLLIAEADRLVDARAAMAIAAQLPRAAVVRFGAESAHEILRETDVVRNRAIAAIDSFLADAAPAA